VAVWVPAPHVLEHVDQALQAPTQLREGVVHCDDEEAPALDVVLPFGQPMQLFWLVLDCHLPAGQPGQEQPLLYLPAVQVCASEMAGTTAAGAARICARVTALFQMRMFFIFPLKKGLLPM